MRSFEIIRIGALKDLEAMHWGIRALDGPRCGFIVAQFICKADAELWIKAYEKEQACD